MATGQRAAGPHPNTVRYPPAAGSTRIRRVCVSSREDRGRYRGRRRAPAPPRTRYAVVVTGAFLGAGVVAMSAASAFPGTDSGPATASATGAFTAADLTDRQAAVDRANRGTDRIAPAAAAATDPIDTGLWLLPLRGYTLAAPFGAHAAAAHPGVTLAAHEGAPFVAAHRGKVVLARHSGGLRYTIVIDAGHGTTITYGHSSRPLVHQGP